MIATGNQNRVTTAGVLAPAGLSKRGLQMRLSDKQLEVLMGLDKRCSTCAQDIMLNIYYGMKDADREPLVNSTSEVNFILHYLRIRGLCYICNSGGSESLNFWLLTHKGGKELLKNVQGTPLSCTEEAKILIRGGYAKLRKVIGRNS